MNKIDLLKEIVLLMRDEHVKTTYPLVYKTLSQQLKNKGIKITDLDKVKF